MEQLPKGTWWSRNWKWVVPVGCLTPIIVCGGGITLILAIVFGAMKSSDVYTEALARARASEEVIEALGEPIEPGFFVSGSIEVTGPSGNADLSIPIRGPQGSATIYVVATKTAGEWEFSTLEVAPKGSDSRIDLLGEP